MNSEHENHLNAFWLAGASFGGKDDQTSRFLLDGIWENGYEDKYLNMVKSVQVGDRIAIKSRYTRKNDLPFDNRGKFIPVMAIKAIGVVLENPGDGRTLKVDWKSYDKPREWFFSSYWHTLTRIQPNSFIANALIEFIFEEKSQDIDRIRNAPSLRERYGDSEVRNQRFKWIGFYEEFANKLLGFRDRREELLSKIHALSSKVDCLSSLQDQFSDGSAGPLKDICPFTVMGLFNRGIKDSNRKSIAGELAALLGVTAPIPEGFAAVPTLNNQNSWFFSYAKDRQPDDINNLWEIFAQALAFVGPRDSDDPEPFINAFDQAAQQRGVAWNLTIGLYWIRPWDFVALDKHSRDYIGLRFAVDVDFKNLPTVCPAVSYLGLMDSIKPRFQEETSPVHSFPELCLDAELQMNDRKSSQMIKPQDIPYSLDDIVGDGCFIERSELVKILDGLRSKKNLILQGPPGTGKTWLARRLAYALIGQKNKRKVRAVQFHPTLSYEDFIRGWRPTKEGRLALENGHLMQLIDVASVNPSTDHVMIIEEINRGNPAQIFGEMLTLLEKDKRSPDEALVLSYRRDEEERVFVPPNLYVIGTMNIADRSLALVDLALRRRFAFIDLKPEFNELWRVWLQDTCGIDAKVIDIMKGRMEELNKTISNDSSLGSQFQVGHSYVTPSAKDSIDDGKKWFLQVVEAEVGPLLKEYWADAPGKADDEIGKLKIGF